MKKLMLLLTITTGTICQPAQGTWINVATKIKNALVIQGDKAYRNACAINLNQQLDNAKVALGEIVTNNTPNGQTAIELQAGAIQLYGDAKTLMNTQWKKAKEAYDFLCDTDKTAAGLSDKIDGAFAVTINTLKKPEFYLNNTLPIANAVFQDGKEWTLKQAFINGFVSAAAKATKKHYKNEGSLDDTSMKVLMPLLWALYIEPQLTLNFLRHPITSWSNFFNKHRNHRFGKMALKIAFAMLEEVAAKQEAAEELQ